MLAKAHHTEKHFLERFFPISRLGVDTFGYEKMDLVDLTTIIYSGPLYFTNDKFILEDKS